ncbi:DMT family transporter [Pokkaliibacter plantistimulans]|uniref:DMT family transporter n=1 Tax=Pokkaliibacter plantistimulans TaxID=1635171 RepID=UPI00398FC01C
MTTPIPRSVITITGLTLVSLTAFAANSVLCRMALGQQSIDAASFTAVRLLSGAAMLWLLLRFKTRPEQGQGRGSWRAGLMLFIYAAAFSYAYTSLTTGTGALILFAAVQLTMLLMALAGGHRMQGLELAGLLIAFTGFVYLVLPGLATPSLLGLVLMTLSGIAWGFYTLAGRGSLHPTQDTAFNMFRAAPLALVMLIIGLLSGHAEGRGIVLAVLSGALASGLGYAVWYTALRSLSALQAAVLQLLVPVIAAAGGVVFMDEHITVRLVIATVLTLSGILLVITARARASRG